MIRYTALALLLGCAKPVVVVERVTLREAEHCLSANVEYEDETETVVSCFSSEKLCQKAFDAASRHGGRAGVTGVTECETKGK